MAPRRQLLRGAVLLTILALVGGGCNWWPSEGRFDPRRCQGACPEGQVCYEGRCARPCAESCDSGNCRVGCAPVSLDAGPPDASALPAPSFRWVTQPRGGESHGRGVAVDQAQSAYLVGDFKGKVSFAGWTTEFESVGGDIFVAKLDDQGDFEWVVPSASGTDARGGGVAVSGGATYVTGSHVGLLQLGKLPALSSSTRQAFAAKLDQKHTYAWVTPLGQVGAAGRAPAIAVDSQGASYLCGAFSGTATIGGKALTAKGLDDAYIAQLDTYGGVTWVTQLGSAGAEACVDVALDDSGNAFVVGNFEQDLVIGTKTLKVGSKGDVFVARLDGKGGFAWAVSGACTQGCAAAATGIGVDALGNSTIVGTFKDGDLSFGSILLQNSAGGHRSRAFRVTFDKQGLATWGVRSADFESPAPADVAASSNGWTYVAGTTPDDALSCCKVPLKVKNTIDAKGLPSGQQHLYIVRNDDKAGLWGLLAEDLQIKGAEVAGAAAGALGEGYVTGTVNGAYLFSPFAVVTLGSSAFVARVGGPEP